METSRKGVSRILCQKRHLPIIIFLFCILIFMTNPSSPPPLTSAQIAQDLPRLIERMHRRYLDVVRIELGPSWFHDISRFGDDAGHDGNEEISVHDLIERGYYLGSNASYN